MTTVEQLFAQCLVKMRYGNLWPYFTFDELIDYARIKAHRGQILYNKGMIDKAEDDILDSVNILFCSVLKMHSLIEISGMDYFTNSSTRLKKFFEKRDEGEINGQV